MLTAAGSGYSRWGDLAITRWREDVTCDAWGSYVFLRDVSSGEVWSAGYQPSGAEPDSYEVAFSEDRAEIVRRDGSLTTTIEVAVSPEDDAEVRRVSISNLGTRTREIELTSYAELVLVPAAADAAHPAFSKLFVQTEFVADVGALLATRRRRSPGERPVWAAHLAVVEGESVGDLQFETDRARFLGRGHSIRTPISVIDGRPLSDTVGAVLDPIFSLRRHVRVPPGATVRVAFWTLVAPSRDEVLDLVDKHHDATAFERAVTLAWTQAQVQLHHLGVGPDEAQLFQRLANRVLYSDPTLRPASEVLSRSQGGPATLWAHGISGDLPIVLVRIDDIEDLEIVRQLLRAHEYWRMKQLAVDLVILNERHASYAQDLQASLEALVRASPSPPHAEGEGARGALFVLRSDLVSAEARAVLRTAARAVLLSRRGSLAEQVKRPEESEPVRAPGSGRSPAGGTPETPLPRPALEFFNGLGGFAAAGREYVTILGEGQWTPAPWINVIANPALRLPGVGRGRWLHVVEQQPRESAHPLVERPRRRPAGRGVLRPRRRRGSALGADRPPDPGRDRAVRRPTRPGLQPLRAHVARNLARALAVRGAGRPDQDLSSRHPESIRALSTSLGHRVRGVGARRRPGRRRTLHRDRDRRGDGSDARTEPVEQRVRGSRGLRGSRRATARLDGRPDRVPRSQRRSRSPGRARGATRRSRIGSAPASIPAAPCKPGSSSGPTSEPRSSASSGRRPPPPRRVP